MLCVIVKEKTMKRDDIFIVDDEVDINLVKPELAETMSIVESMLMLMQEDLREIITCAHQLWFVQTMIKQLYLTMKLYRKFYSANILNESYKSIFSVNRNIEKTELHDELSSSMHQLHSLCYLAAYRILDNLDSHTVNGLTVISKHMQRAAHLIDILAIQ